jgi:hypothetical protein
MRVKDISKYICDSTRPYLGVIPDVNEDNRPAIAAVDRWGGDRNPYNPNNSITPFNLKKPNCPNNPNNSNPNDPNSPPIWQV